MRKRICQIVYRSQPGDEVSRVYDHVIVAFALLSLVPLAFKPEQLTGVLGQVMGVVDTACTYLLALDYILCWCVCDLARHKPGWRSFVAYPFTPAAIVDLLALLPSLGLVPTSFMFLRLLRVIKVFRNSRWFTVVGRMLVSQGRALLSVFFFTVGYVAVVALAVFVNEPQSFDTFFDAMQWSVTTLTSVGFGQDAPAGELGKAVSMLSAIVGLGVVALPSGIIAGAFVTEMNAVKEHGDAYFSYDAEHAYKGRNLSDYKGVRDYFSHNAKVARYLAVMALCCCINFVLFEISTFVGLPMVLDTVGTALAAFLLEPTAGIIVAYVNALVLALQISDVSALPYLSEAAVVALVFGHFFKRGEPLRARTAVRACLIVTLATAALEFGIDQLHFNDMANSFVYVYFWMLAVDASPGLALFVSILAKRLVDAVFVTALFCFLGKRLMGRCAPGDVELEQARARREAERRDCACAGEGSDDGLGARS